MRWTAIVLLGIVALAPWGSAWSESDPSGDTTTEPGGQSAAAGWIDITDLSLVESKSDITVKLRLSSPPCDTSEDHYLVHVQRGAATYSIENFPKGQCSEWRIVNLNGTSSRTVAEASGEIEGTEISVVVPRNTLLDEKGVPLAAGTSLTSIHAEARAGGNLQVGPARTPAVVDRGPDTGSWPPFISAAGATNGGFIFMESATPLRVSNGEATTFVYDVRLVNLGEAEQVVTLLADDVPDTWTLHVPPAVRLAGGETVRFPVILSLPFEHHHGETAWFGLRAEAGDEPEHWAELALGVHWVEVAQPSGHHPEVFLHSAPSGSMASTGAAQHLWFNTLMWGEDPGATEDPAAFNLGENEVGQDGTYVVEAALQPELLLGLDFELDRPAALEAVFSYEVSDTFLASAALLYSCTSAADCSQVVVAASEPEEVEIGPDPTRVMMPLRLNRSADLIPYEGGSNLILRFELYYEGLAAPTTSAAGTTTPSPHLHPDESKMTLPLRDYHDPIEDAFASVHGLALSTTSEQARRANPGDIVVWEIEARNPLDTTVELSVDLHGTSREWGALSHRSATVGGNGATNFTLVVRVPEAATENHRFAAAFVAEAQDNPNVVAVLPLSVEVVPESVHDYPSDAPPEVQRQRQSPGSGLVWSALVIGGAFLLRRRR